MCGIIACARSADAGRRMVEALERLEYRGYDSAGIAVPGPDGRAEALRTVLRVADLSGRLEDWTPVRAATTGIGHTRWATHGEVSLHNAHPHRDCSGRIAVVHNGVLDNVHELRRLLEGAGHTLQSETDSELIAHLVEARLEVGLRGAVEQAVSSLRGTWAIVVLDALTGDLVATSRRSPLIVAESEEGVFAASDIGAIAPWIRQYRVVTDGDVVELNPSQAWFRDGRPAAPPDLLDCTVVASDLSHGLYPDFMAKEIEQQPDVAAEVLATWAPSILDGLWPSFSLPVPKHVTVVACGTSLHAGRVIAQVLAQQSRIPFTAVEASELAATVTPRDSLALVLSQSGETADVLVALTELRLRGHAVVALTNQAHSALARQADAVMVCHAGPEVGVAATKTFIAQVVGGVCAVLSLLASERLVARSDIRRMVRDLERLPEALAHAVGVSRRTVAGLADTLSEQRGFLFLGRGEGRVFADEGALKLKELTYRWAESHAAGELKHGPLALIEQGTPVIAVDDDSARFAATLAEVAARGARTITIGGPGTTIPVVASHEPGAIAQTIDWLGPIEAVVAMQMLSRELAVSLGRDVDKPRNLAKSVTVE